MTDNPSPAPDNVSSAIRALLEAHQKVVGAQQELEAARAAEPPTTGLQEKLAEAERQVKEKQDLLNSMFQSGAARGDLSSAVGALVAAHQNVAKGEAELKEAQSASPPTEKLRDKLDAAKRALEEEQSRLDSLYQSGTFKTALPTIVGWALTLLVALGWMIVLIYVSQAEPSRPLVVTAFALASGLAVLAVVIVLSRSRSRNLTPAGRELSASHVPILRLQDAANRVADAQGIFDEAEKKVKNDELTIEQTKDADTKARQQLSLTASKDNLAKARKALQFEQKSLDQMLSGRSFLLDSGNLQFLVFGALSLIVLGSLMWGIFGRSLLPSLASVTVSRGLITFLIAMVTVTIALILVLATVVSDSPDRQQRFMQGKEILTMLIGVLGTIVGFYFGNLADTKVGLQIEAPSVSNDAPMSGEKINVASSVSGGKAPFTVDLGFLLINGKTPPFETPKQIQSPDGTFTFQVATKKVDENTPVFYQISAHDSEGRTGIYDSRLHGGYIEVIPGKASQGNEAKPAK